MEPGLFNFYFRRDHNGWEWHIGWFWVAILAGLIWWAL